MDEFFQKVTGQMDPFKSLASHIPGFKGYVERQNRRDADKLLRDTVARRFDEQWKRASQLQVDMVSQGMITYVDDMERPALFVEELKRPLAAGRVGLSVADFGPAHFSNFTFSVVDDPKFKSRPRVPEAGS